jgi:4-hydroxybenzoate polyprenyltransferase/phosphoserine phosphatase
VLVWCSLPAAEAITDVPLCVDLDGTLVRTDMLHETTLQLLMQAPLALARIPGWLLQGKARLKHEIAALTRLEVAQLPYRQEVLDLIAQARAQNRRVVLATAAAPQIADAVARHLGLFDEVLCSDTSTNLSAEAKGQRLAERFGAGGFDYVGNGRCDLPVWRQARQVIIVSDDRRLHKHASRHGQQVQRIAGQGQSLKLWSKALRVHQWLKNLLVFVPLFAGQKAGDLELLLSAVLAFVAFSLAASSVYIINDLVDLASDRRHRYKRNRPFASGALPIKAGLIAAPLLLLSSFLVALLLPPLFLAALTLYVLITSAYSFRLKRQVVVDVILLAGLYTMRIIAGSAATYVEPSFWLLAFSMFIFLSLALVKRYSELRLAVDEKTLLAGRGYLSADLPVLMALGASSGMMSVMVLALYIDSPTVAAGYEEPLWLWMVPPAMLYWAARLWMKTHRGEVHDDPVVFAARDRQSIVIVLALGLVFLAAVRGWRPF